MSSVRQRYAVGVALAAIILGAGLLRVSHLGAHRFHVDEALFSAYGLSIATGVDPWLMNEPVDKPPLFFYILAASFRLFGASETAAGLPSLVASLASILLVYYLGLRVFGQATALVAAFLMAVSPFNVAYSFTAFIDPVMVAVALLAIVLAERRLCFAAAFAAGLLPALKVQGVLFWPAIGLVGIIALAWVRPPRRRWARAAAEAVVGVSLPLLGLHQWSNARVEQRPFMELAAEHNPLVPAHPATYPARLVEWWDSSLTYLAGPSPLDYLLVAGLPLLLAWTLFALWRGGENRRTLAMDLLLLAYFAFFIGWHVYYELPAWDRYMLGVVPFGLVLLARIVVLPGRVFERFSPAAAARPWLAGTMSLLLPVLLLTAAVEPIKGGLRSAYPIGWSGAEGHMSYHGIDVVAAYLRANLPPDAVIYDYQTLSWHYKYYLFGAPYRIVWFDDSLLWSFQHSALDLRELDKYLVLPCWIDDEDTRRELEGELVRLEPVYRVYRDDGVASFTVYRVDVVAD